MIDMLGKAAEFIKNCSEKTAIVYDVDGDSIGAAVIISKTIERLFGYAPKAYLINHDLFAVDRGIYKKVMNEKIKNVIMLDFAVDESPEYVEKMSNKARILVIDHHQIHKNMNSGNVLYVNPHFWNSEVPPVKYCVSKLAYDACARIADIKDLSWLAGLGIINDYCGDAWKGFLDEVYKIYPILKKGTEPYSFDSNLGLINHMITSGYYHSGLKGAKVAYEACLEVASPLDILEARTSKARLLKRLYTEVQVEINNVVDNWRDQADVHGDLAFIELKTKFSIQSPVSTILSIRNPHTTLVILRRKGEHFHASFRRQDGKVDCGKLAGEATKGLENANGGGHVPAAGAHFLAKDIEKFKENVLRLVIA
jgi:nanoRNase/pAp phosphatase (c-di-AMP/oligoRNAs hydrolase)